MKISILPFVILSLACQCHASEVIPPRIVVKWLIKAVQDEKPAVIEAHFKYNEKEYRGLTPFSRHEQLQLLKDLPLDQLRFDKDEYAVDEGKRFVVCLVAPTKLDFEMQKVEQLNTHGELGPPWKYDIVAIRETAQPSIVDAILKKDVETGTAAHSNAPSYNAGYAGILPDAVQKLRIGQSYSSVTNNLGLPVHRRVLNFQNGNVKTTPWVVVYVHSQNNRIYYQMLFSGENGRPSKLLSVEGYVLIDSERIPVGFLSIRNEAL